MAGSGAQLARDAGGPGFDVRPVPEVPLRQEEPDQVLHAAELVGVYRAREDVMVLGADRIAESGQGRGQCRWKRYPPPDRTDAEQPHRTAGQERTVMPDELRRRGHPPGGIHGAANDESVIACRVTRVPGRRKVHLKPARPQDGRYALGDALRRAMLAGIGNK